MSAVTQTQRLYQVRLDHMSPVRVTSTAHFRCSYVGDNITVQYVSWNKVAHDGKRSYVYEYSDRPHVAKAYNSFVGRAYVKRNERPSFKQRELTYRPFENIENFRNIDDSPYSKAVDYRNSYNDELSSDNKLDYSLDSLPTIYHGQEAALVSMDYNQPLDDVEESVYGKKGQEESEDNMEMDHTFIPVFHSDPSSSPLQNDTEAEMDEYYFKSPASDDFGGYINAAINDAASVRRKKRSLPTGHMDLYLSDVKVTDEAHYECTVKPQYGPAMSNIIPLVVHGLYYITSHYVNMYSSLVMNYLDIQICTQCIAPL